MRIIIGNDGSSGAQHAIRSVAGRSWPESTEVRVLSVVQTQGRNELETATRGVSAGPLHRAGLNVIETLIEGDPRQDLIREAQNWNSDAIFVGARGQSGIDRFLLGSVSTAVVTRARCTVEVVR